MTHVTLSTLDIAIFLGSIVLIMAVGLWSGRREKDTEDFFLAGRSVPWWGITGSIFGTNISANHLVGMMGIGYSIGFAQAHFEIGAVAALMLLCYVFLPLYRRMGIYTLSEYLGRRFDERSRVAYAITILVFIVLVHMVIAFYIGSRSMLFLLRGTPLEVSYTTGIVVFALVTACYTIVGGLKAVIWTDAIQSLLLLTSGILVALFVFAQPEIGGLTGLMAKDAALPPAEQKFHLYLPPNHPDIPWTGIFTGLMILHFSYWGTNQFIVQRTLAARTGFDGRMGIVAAGYLKLLIPFFSIAGGIAAGHLFQARVASGELEALPQPDDAFSMLVRLVVPAGYGLAGIITAGVIGAILSSLDSMMNSGATILTFDFYKRYIRREAGERELLFVGRICIVFLVMIPGWLAAVSYTETEGDNFFLRMADQSSHLLPGILVAFLVGALWPRATATGGFLIILLSPFFSIFIERAYNHLMIDPPRIAQWVQLTFGSELNFLHRVALTALFGFVLVLFVSLVTRRDRASERYTWWAYRADPDREPPRPFWRSERPWAWLLCGLAIWMMIYFA